MAGSDREIVARHGVRRVVAAAASGAQDGRRVMLTPKTFHFSPEGSAMTDRIVFHRTKRAGRDTWRGVPDDDEGLVLWLTRPTRAWRLEATGEPARPARRRRKPLTA